MTDIGRLRSEIETLRARLAAAERVVEAARAIQFSRYPAHGSGMVTIACEPERGRFAESLAAYDQGKVTICD